jgi:hypothetical protein
MNGERLAGQCLCGAVRFTAIPKRNEMGVCHCGMCRRWAGGVFTAVSCGTSVEIEDDNQLGVYRSSDWGERCFCKNCGSTLFWRMRDESNTAVSAQAFSDPGRFLFTSQIFIDEKPANYDFANETEKLTSVELFAQLNTHLAGEGAQT